MRWQGAIPLPQSQSAFYGGVAPLCPGFTGRRGVALGRGNALGAHGRRCGGTAAAHSAAAGVGLSQSADHGHRTPAIGAGLVPGTVSAASIGPIDGHVEPVKVIAACLQQARAHGTVVHVDTPVLACGWQPMAARYDVYRQCRRRRERLSVMRWCWPPGRRPQPWQRWRGCTCLKKKALVWWCAPIRGRVCCRPCRYSTCHQSIWRTRNSPAPARRWHAADRRGFTGKPGT